MTIGQNLNARRISPSLEIAAICLMGRVSVQHITRRVYICISQFYATNSERTTVVYQRTWPAGFRLALVPGMHAGWAESCHFQSIPLTPFPLCRRPRSTFETYGNFIGSNNVCVAQTVTHALISAKLSIHFSAITSAHTVF